MVPSRRTPARSDTPRLPQCRHWTATQDGRTDLTPIEPCEDNAQKGIARLEANGWNCQQSARDGRPPSVNIVPQGSGSSEPAAEQPSIPTKSPTFAAPF